MLDKGSKVKNEPAFPGKICVGHTVPEDQPIYEHPKGLTKREYFAGLAMQGFGYIGKNEYSGYMKECVELADALIKELGEDNE